jgi:hypothetical protein
MPRKPKPKAKIEVPDAAPVKLTEITKRESTIIHSADRVIVTMNPGESSAVMKCSKAMVATSTNPWATGANEVTIDLPVEAMYHGDLLVESEIDLGAIKADPVWATAVRCLKAGSKFAVQVTGNVDAPNRICFVVVGKKEGGRVSTIMVGAF